MILKTILHSVTPRSRLQAAMLTAILVGSLTAGVSYASIPDSIGVIHGCYKLSNKATPLKVIDTAKTSQCPHGYASVTWNQTGPQGPAGATGAMGDTGPQGPAGVGGMSGIQEFTSTSTWTAPTGTSHVMIEAAGGGGGGGLANATCGSYSNTYSGQVGGIGGFVETVVPVTPGDSYMINVGVGGVGATQPDGAASAGSDSELISPDNTVVADAQGGSAGSDSAAVDVGCDVEAPTAASNGSATAISPGGFLLPGGGCKMPLSTVGPTSAGVPCGQGGKGGQYYDAFGQVIGPSSGQNGGAGDVVLEW